MCTSCLHHVLNVGATCVYTDLQLWHSGAREVARDARASEPDDLVNSVVGGMASGALLGRFQG